MALRPSQLVDPEADFRLEQGPRFVSRGGIKLDNAIEALDIVVADATASIRAPRPAASPTASCSGARRVWPPSTSPTARSTCACARILA